MTRKKQKNRKGKKGIFPVLKEFIFPIVITLLAELWKPTIYINKRKMTINLHCMKQ